MIADDEMVEKITLINNFIVEQKLSNVEMLVLIGYLQSAIYETLQESLNKVKHV